MLRRSPKRKTTLHRKLMISIVVVLVVAVLGVGLPSYLFAKNALDEKGKTLLKNAVEMALTIIGQQDQLVKAGIASKEEAMEAVKSYLVGPLQEDGTRALQTPVDLGKSGYFIAYSQDGYEEMHPNMEGEYVWEVTGYGEPDRYIVQEQIALAHNGGFMTYHWPYHEKAGAGKKFSYSQIDPHWGWVVVATAYASDFNLAANRILLMMVSIGLLLLGVGIYFSYLYIRQITRPIFEVTGAMESTKDGHFPQVNINTSAEELAVLVRGFNDLSSSLGKQQQELTRLAYYDGLTKLPNLHNLTEFVDQLREEEAGMLMVMDIKELKTINSIYGLQAGDVVIKAIGKVMGEELSPYGGLVSRIGGNEFAVFLPGTYRENILALTSRIEEKLGRTLRQEDLDLPISFTSAYAAYPQDGASSSDLLQKVNTALQYGKAMGLPLLAYEEFMSAQIEEEATLKRQAAEGLENGEFYPVYQPKVEVETMRIIGVEALARWTRGMSPGSFIPVLSRANMMTTFTEFMIRKVLGDYQDLCNKYGNEVSVALNISPQFFIKEHFVSFMVETARAFKVPCSKIVLEITEDLMLADLELASKKITQLRQHGLKISLDDFGTGYSSLKYLTQLPLDEVKIDRSFIEHIVEDHRAYELFTKILELGKTFEYDIVAEGVEHKDQMDFILSAGCQVMQGYYFAKPSPL